MFTGLDHVAVVVPDTGAALAVWRDRLGFPVLFSEVVGGGAVRLTHLDLGGTHLQLVEPLAAGHPLHDWLRANGPGLHHVCLKADDAGAAHERCARSGLPPAGGMHDGTLGRRAWFLDPAVTGGVRVEVTGP